MHGYMIVHFDIVDREQLNRYAAAVVPITKAHQGKILVGNESREILEGSAAQMTVLIQFPSGEAARSFYESPEYQPVKPLRTESTTNTSCLIVSGEAMGA